MKNFTDLELQNIILKHPYFKNPNHYYIRIITIMKFLKKKGIDISNEISDIRIDRILMSIEGVERIGNDRYRYEKK